MVPAPPRYFYVDDLTFVLKDEGRFLGFLTNFILQSSGEQFFLFI